MVVNSEVVARAHLENRGAPVATPDSTHLHHQVREHALASEDPLRVVAEGPVNRDVLRALVEANTQTRDAAGGVIESTALRNSGLANIDRLADIQRGEVADLNRLAADPAVIRSLESVIGQNVDLNTLYRGLSLSEQRDYREALLRDPNTKRKISEMLQQRGAPDKLLADELESLRIEGDRLTQERTRLTTERATKSTDLANNQNELREYQTRVDSSTTPPTIVEGAFTQELTRLQSVAEPLRQDVDILRSQVDKLQEDIQHARNSKVSLLGHPSVDTSTPAGVSKTTGLDVEVTDLENRLAARKTQLRNRTNELQQHEQRINSINARKTALEDAVASAKTRIAEIDSRLGEISPEYAQNQSRLHTAETRDRIHCFIGYYSW